MIAIITEKPSQARNFAKALGGMSGTYDGKQYEIVAARGHLYEYSDPAEQVPKNLAAQYKSWDIDNLPWDEQAFAWKREKKDGVSDTLRTLKAVLSKADSVYMGGDIDPSGEGGLISIEILDELKIKPREVRRMYFYDESPKSIQDAFKTAKAVPDVHQLDEYLKASYRTKFDFLTMQFTRIAKAYGDGYSVLRQGRLKSAMVLIVGDGLKALAGYKKIPFYQNRFRDENGNLYTNKDEPVFPDKSQVPKSYRQGHVMVDKKDVKHTAPPKLLDLAGLSSILAGKGFKAKLVLSTYQKMYECTTPLRPGCKKGGGVLSYPRTEDATITPEQFNELLPLADMIAGVVGVDPRLLTHQAPRKTHVKTGGAHGANRPGTNVPQSLDQVEQTFGACGRAIYEILARNYLAMLCEDYEYESQSGHVTEYPKFIGTCSVPLKQGWKQVFQSGDDDDLNGKGLGTTATPFVFEGFPPKPPMPTVKWLMKQLEAHDVGTGATRVSTYSEVTNEKSKYPLMKETRGRLDLTQYGEMSYALLPGTRIGSLDLTEEVQADMRLIAEGKLDGDKALRKVQEYVIHDIAVMKKNSQNISKGATGMNGNFAKKEKYEGIWNGKDVSFNREWSGHRFTDEECEALCRGETVQIMDCVSAKSGKTFGAEGKLSNLEYNGNKYVGFERTAFLNDNGEKNDPNACPKSWCNHTFTDEEKTRLEAGEDVYCDGFLSKKGNLFGCKVRWDFDPKAPNGPKKIIPLFD